MSFLAANGKDVDGRPSPTMTGKARPEKSNVNADWYEATDSLAVTMPSACIRVNLPSSASRTFFLAVASNPEDLHRLIAIVVDHLHRDMPGLRRRERPASALYSVAHASASISARSADFSRSYGSLPPRKYACRTKKLSLVVIRVDEPAGDVVLDLLEAHLAGGGIEDIDALQLAPRTLPSSRRSNPMSGSPNTVNRLPPPAL